MAQENQLDRLFLWMMCQKYFLKYWYESKIALTFVTSFQTIKILDFSQFSGLVLFMFIFTAGFWLLIFLLTFVVPYWIVGTIWEKWKLKQDAKKITKK